MVCNFGGSSAFGVGVGVGGGRRLLYRRWVSVPLSWVVSLVVVLHCERLKGVVVWCGGVKGVIVGACYFCRFFFCLVSSLFHVVLVY